MQDLHLHLSGATSPVLLYEMINEAGLKMASKNYEHFLKTITMDRSKIKNLDDYLEVLHIIDDAQSSPRAVRLSVYNSFMNAYLDGCRYMELRWNPYKRSQQFKVDLDKLIISARSGFEKAASIFGIDGGLILCLGRDVSEDANEGIFKKAIQYFEKGVKGIDIAGPEKTPLKEEFKHYYKTARALGMDTTLHVGEINYEGTEDSLAEVLEHYKPKRIGHGIQIHNFPNLMKKAARDGTMFEVCITSNLTTRAVEEETDFIEIFKKFEDHGVKYCINTDATFSLNTNITKENEKFKRIKEMASKKIKSASSK